MQLSVNQMTDGIVVHSIKVDFVDASMVPVVHVTQYDNGARKIEAHLFSNGAEYIVPADANVSIRLDKTLTGTDYYKPAESVSGNVVMFAVEQQMTVHPGKNPYVIEVISTAGRIATAVLYLDVAENPIKDEEFKDEEELESLQLLIGRADIAAGKAEASQAAAALSEQNSKLSEEECGRFYQSSSMASETCYQASLQCRNSEKNAKASETASKSSETNAKASEEAAKQYAENAQGAAKGFLGYYATASALKGAHPTANNSSRALVGETVSVWMWKNSKWEDTSEYVKKLDGQEARWYAPAGMVVPFAGAAVPDGWLLCDGSEVRRGDYMDLYMAIGEKYGEGNGSTTFNLPDLRSRVVAGVVDESEIGTKAGEDSHLLTRSELPNEKLSISDNGYWFVDSIQFGVESGKRIEYANRSGAKKIETPPLGDGNPIDMRQNTLYMNYIIKY